MAFAIQGEKILRKRITRQMAAGKLGDVLEGDEDLARKLSMLGKQSTVNKMLRPGIREAASAVRKKAKALAPTESGLLKRSIASKNLTIGGKVVVAIVGPRTDRTEYVVRRFPDGRAIGVKANPAKYAHLVEFGSIGGTRVVKKPGKRYGQTFTHPGSAPKPFMRPAWDGTPAQRIIARRTEHELRKAAQGRVGKVKADKSAVAALKKAGK